jgi:uncharacterized protein
MDYILENNYQRPFWMPGRHAETIIPALWRTVADPGYVRERLELADDDFLDLDWLQRGNSHLVIICHGLEGSTDRPYVRGMAKALINSKLDVLAWNFRGCSGEMNRLPRFYHSGETGDLNLVILHALERFQYTSVSLIGFSLGGNLILKYLGEAKRSPLIPLRKAISISAPIHLASCSEVIAMPHNKLYTLRFLSTLKAKVKAKAEVFPQYFDLRPLKNLNSVYAFDEYYTAPLHGFKNAIDYYTKNSALQFLENIDCETLLVNAKNDPFLSEKAFPSGIQNPKLRTIYPNKGGHVGFSALRLSRPTWIELLAVDWLSSS